MWFQFQVNLTGILSVRVFLMGMGCDVYAKTR